MSNYNEKYASMTGTYYHAETPEQVCDILEESRISQTRIKIHYGDPKNGKPWGDTVSCIVGRSTGTQKIPLEIKTRRSIGGGAILDNCIVKITQSTKPHRVLYQK